MKREHSFTFRMTDAEFDAINAEYQRKLRAVLDGVNFSLSSMIRSKALKPDSEQGKQRESLSYKRIA